MKIKLCVVACLILSALSYTMDDNPNVVLTTSRGGLGRHYTLKPAEVAQITIEQCAQCSKAAAQRCGGCHVVYYCSPEHQTAHWQTHQKICKKFQSDIEHLRKAFSVYVDKALETGEQKYVDQATSFHLQTLIRIVQDKACSHDETISEYKPLVEHKDRLGELENRIGKRALRLSMEQAKTNALSRVRQLTTENKLVPPYGVRRYGMQAFLAAERTADEFVPQEEWLEKRLNALIPVEQKLQETVNEQNRILAESEKI